MKAGCAGSATTSRHGSSSPNPGVRFRSTRLHSAAVRGGVVSPFRCMAITPSWARKACQAWRWCGRSAGNAATRSAPSSSYTAGNGAAVVLPSTRRMRIRGSVSRLFMPACPAGALSPPWRGLASPVRDALAAPRSISGATGGLGGTCCGPSFGLPFFGRGAAPLNPSVPCCIFDPTCYYDTGFYRIAHELSTVNPRRRRPAEGRDLRPASWRPVPTPGRRQKRIGLPSVQASDLRTPARS